jgi:hypothetical protein
MTLASESPSLRSTFLAIRAPPRNNFAMLIGDRLRKLRAEKKLSQGDIEKRTALSFERG